MHNNNESSSGKKKSKIFTDRMKRSQFVSEGLKGLHRGSPEEWASNRESTNSDAVFLGWQSMLSGETVPLFNIVLKNHPLYHSTVTEDTLRKHNLQVPQFPGAFNRKLDGSGSLK